MPVGVRGSGFDGGVWMGVGEDELRAVGEIGGESWELLSAFKYD